MTHRVFETMARGIFETNSSFCVKWRAARGVKFLFFKNFLLVLAGLSFWWGGRGGLALGHHSMGFGHFPDIS